MAPKPTEVRLIAGLLESECDDTGTLARILIEALDSKRAADNTHWVILTQWGDIVQVVGPFPTEHQCGKALARLAAPGPGPMRAVVRRVRSVDDVTAADRLPM